MISYWDECKENSKVLEFNENFKVGKIYHREKIKISLSPKVLRISS